MKKQLWIAFLTLTFPFFVAAKPNDAELLVHLKIIQEDLGDIQQEVNIELQELSEEYGEENYFFLLNMITEIDQQLNHALKNNIFGIRAIELICNDMQTVSGIENIITTNFNSLLATNCLYATSDEHKTALIKSMFIKHHTEYCKNYPDGDLTELQFIELCQPDILCPFLLTCALGWLQNLPNEIEEKIKELEQASIHLP